MAAAYRGRPHGQEAPGGVGSATPTEEDEMPTYVLLIDWTQQGVERFADSVDRYEAARGDFEKMGVNFKSIYWTLGNHDIVSIVEAPDGETLAAALLKLASQGNLRTTTLRALSADEMRGVIAKAT
jgi:uncharacterized protein with GYD domain